MASSCFLMVVKKPLEKIYYWLQGLSIWRKSFESMCTIIFHHVTWNFEHHFFSLFKLCFWILALAVHSLYSSQRSTRFFDLASCRAFSMKRYRINTRLVCAMIDGVHYNLHLMRVKWLLAISLQESLNLHVLYLRFSSIHV